MTITTIFGVQAADRFGMVTSTTQGLLSGVSCDAFTLLFRAEDVSVLDSLITAATEARDALLEQGKKKP